MKRLIRIPLGIMFAPLLLAAGTYIWLFEKDMSWSREVGIQMWNLVSGQWDEFLDED
jgi:hypothetical protein